MSEFCQGCGAAFQSHAEHKPGYRTSSDHTLCVRCFSLRHYNKPVDLEESCVLRVIPSDALGVVIIDLFDLELGFLSRLPRHFSGQFLFVANKIDLFGDALSPVKTKDYLRRLLREYGLKPLDVYLTSVHYPRSIEQLLDGMAQYQKDEIYLIGPTNAGKSSLLNQMLSSLEIVHEVTVSPFANTTLDHIGIQLRDVMLYDTPGLLRDHHIHHMLSSSLPVIIPKKVVKPTTYQLAKPTTLYIAGFGYVTVPTACSVTIYTASSLPLHKRGVEGADIFFTSHNHDILQVPTPEEASLLGPMVFDTINVRQDEDLIFEGIGFIYASINLRLEIHHYAAVKVYTRPRLLGRL
jgi:30S ribosome assembly GTPase